MVVDTLLPASRAVINTTQRSAVISGSTGGANETYVVSAVSDVGEGNRSEPLSVSSCPPAVGGLSSLSQTTSAIVLTWAAPTITTGLPVTSYTVKRNNGTLSADVSVAVVCGGTALATTCNVSGLEGGRVYDLQVSATSLAGEGFYSTASPVATAPAAVSASSVSGSLMTSTSMSLTWEEPVTAAGGMPPSGYIVYRNDGGSTPVTTVAYEGRGSTARVANISGLSGGVTYSFQVAAVSDAGQGDSSGVFMQSTAPAAPTALNTTGQTASTIGLRHGQHL